MEFVERGDDIVLRVEEYDAVRTIHMSPAGGTEDAIPSLLGYSTGRWEGDTLVVTTKHMSNSSFAGGVRLSNEMELVERFTPSSDGSRLDYRAIVTDPSVLPEPIQLEKFWLYVPNDTVQPYECVQG